MKTETYSGMVQFFEMVDRKFGEIDWKPTLAASTYSYKFKTDEDLRFMDCLDATLEDLNNVIGKKYFNIEESELLGRTSIFIRIYEDSDLVELPLEAPELVVVEEEEEEEPEFEDGMEILSLSSEVVQEPEVKTVDWVWVDSLEDNKEGKIALDEYAEQFGVKLKRNMKLENMIAKFKEELAD